MTLNRLLLIAALLITPAVSRATAVSITGTLVVGGSPATGTGCFKLPVNAVDTSLHVAVGTLPLCYPVTNGVFPAFAQINSPNDVVQPSGTYYVFRFTDVSGRNTFNANYYVASGSAFNIGLALPTSVTTSNISYLNPVRLDVNNVWTAIQTFPLNSIPVNELVPGADGQFLGVVGGTATWLPAPVTTTLQVNAVTTANTVNFGNLPAAAANNILGVWQYSAGSISVELPATGTGTKFVSGAGSYTSGHSVVIDANGNVVDSGSGFTASAILQYIRKVGGTCTTGSNSYDNCLDTLTWPVAFSDNSYAVVCAGIGGTDPRGYWQVSSHTTTTVTFKTITGGTNPVSFSEIHCQGTR